MERRKTMSRESSDHYQDGRLIDGFDYEVQAWAFKGIYVNCAHPENMNCQCYGREHQGEKTKTKGKGK
jgi:hypothetical protein